MERQKKSASVLDVGNCDPDHGMISRMLTKHFNVKIDRVMFVRDALQRMRAQAYNLVLVNRLIFDDESEGIELVRQAKADPALAATPVMMISNFADAQENAVSAGGVRGFGKAAVASDESIAILSAFLPKRE